MSDRRRVVVITPDFPPAKGGIQTLSDRIVASLTALEPTVVTLAHGDAADFDRSRDFKIVRTSRRFGNRSLRIVALNALAGWLGYRERPDVILSTHIVASPAAAFLAHNFDIPFVQYVHAKELGARRALSRFAVTRADRVIAVSNYTRGLAMQAGAWSERIALISPGVDLPPKPRPLGTRGKTANVLTVSRLEDRYKGHDVMLRAIPLVRAKVPHVSWRIIGDGPLRPILEDRAHALGLDGTVHFLGPLTDSNRDREFDEADAFCMVSRRPAGGFAGEGFGIVYLEANAHCLPVVAGAVCGATDAVLDGETGLLVDPEDHLAVADALVTLLRDRELAHRLGRAGRVRAEQLSWTAVGRKVELELQRVLR